MEYLGVPIFYGKAKAIYFEELLNRVRRKMDGWSNKLLSHGGRLILLKHVLSSMPIYLFSAFSVPKSIVKALEVLFSNFTEGKKKRKWISWQKITRPTEMGGLARLEISCYDSKSFQDESNLEYPEC
ncbi:hypothetical protein FRX31_011849 [Thalictrum thalictroides]|uniref:Uncharacterized protein n=1 Tax=Thalictrum thalictroides TaxID=46969 RepID=A0A7J6WMG9_THATH|nr:hypothetical protein FRX31_011849 [Thalictrum thalictroides]